MDITIFEGCARARQRNSESGPHDRSAARVKWERCCARVRNSALSAEYRAEPVQRADLSLTHGKIC
jgi:hypothetical protein